MQFKALIFDCDGTLSDSMPLHFKAWREIMTDAGIVFTEDRFYETAGMPTNKIIAMLAEEQKIEVDVQTLLQVKEKRFLEQIHELKSISQVEAVVRENFGKIPMAVASGGYRYVIERQVNQLGLASFFQTMVCAEDTALHKPHPDVFLEAARRLGVDPKDCCVYEDAALGFEAARRAGMHWVDVNTFHTPRRIT